MSQITFPNPNAREVVDVIDRYNSAFVATDTAGILSLLSFPVHMRGDTGTCMCPCEQEASRIYDCIFGRGRNRAFKPLELHVRHMSQTSGGLTFVNTDALVGQTESGNPRCFDHSYSIIKISDSWKISAVTYERRLHRQALEHQRY